MHDTSMSPSITVVTASPRASQQQDEGMESTSPPELSLEDAVVGMSSEIEQTMATVAVAEDTLNAIVDGAAELWQGIIESSTNGSAANGFAVDGDSSAISSALPPDDSFQMVTLGTGGEGAAAAAEEEEEEEEVVMVAAVVDPGPSDNLGGMTHSTSAQHLVLSQQPTTGPVEGSASAQLTGGDYEYVVLGSSEVVNTAAAAAEPIIEIGNSKLSNTLSPVSDQIMVIDDNEEEAQQKIDVHLQVHGVESQHPELVHGHEYPTDPVLDVSVPIEQTEIISQIDSTTADMISSAVATENAISLTTHLEADALVQQTMGDVAAEATNIHAQGIYAHAPSASDANVPLVPEHTQSFVDDSMVAIAVDDGTQMPVGQIDQQQPSHAEPHKLVEPGILGPESDAAVVLEKLEAEKKKRKNPLAACGTAFVVVLGFTMALGSHISIGTQPVFSSYLQNVTAVPPMSLNFLASTSMLVTIFLPAKLIMLIAGYIKRQVREHKRRRLASVQFQYHETVKRKSTMESLATVFRQARSIRPARAAQFLVQHKHKVALLLGRIGLTALVLAMFAAVLLLRSLSLLFGARFAQPTYIALIKLLEPFFTTIMGVGVAFLQSRRKKKREQMENGQTGNEDKKKETKRRRRPSFPIFPILITFWLLLACVGGGLIILGTTSRSTDGSFTWLLNVNSLTTSFTMSDALGSGLTLFAVLLQSVYNIFIMFLMVPAKSAADGTEATAVAPRPEKSVHNKSITNNAGTDVVTEQFVDLEMQNAIDAHPVSSAQDSNKEKPRARVRPMRFSGFDMVLVQFIIYSSGYLVLGAATGEMPQWGKWLELSVIDYVIAFLYAFLVFFAVDILYAYASKLISSQNVASIMATSLLSTMCFAWVINGDPINNIWMIIGALLVVVAVTFFIVTRRMASKKSEKRRAKLEKAALEATSAISTAVAVTAATVAETVIEDIPYLDNNDDLAFPSEDEKHTSQQIPEGAVVVELFDVVIPSEQPFAKNPGGALLDVDIARDVSNESLLEQPTAESHTDIPQEIQEDISAAVAVLESDLHEHEQHATGADSR